MESYVLDWANLLLRWLHVITAIAWVGSSFYFVFLDSSLTPPQDEDLKRQGVSGELWAVHGGGFYHPVKFALAPPKLPQHLHWFYWESYTTWMSGFALFTVSYLWNASTYLIDKSLIDWSPAAAVTAAIGFMVVFWLAYDVICRVFGDQPRGDTIVGALVAVLVAAASWLACQWFPGRAAFLLVGAMIATAMSANVLFWIIPGQRKMVAAIRAGQPVDPVHGLRGKQRSVHNTYFTLPVLLAMLSNHYSFLWNHPRNWLVLVLLMFAGAAIRQFFVMRHGWKLGRNRNPLPYALVGSVAIAATAVWLAPAPQAANAAALPATVGYAQVKPIIEQRCAMCHGAQLQMKNVRLDTPESLKQHAAGAYQQAVVARLMPMNNSTGMTEAERSVLGRWFQQGAKVD
ncbi:MAG: FIG137887: membrane protein related to purine degradation [uncultured Ramlibacter sp.]|uniref:FIG137887: membrane protein related to purine degradation n=1 Tax=uncultured Ramlibacter sp. TaxID=260755 RepID=A0A6J4P1A3_9BURK|nr:MAG: FIG137887: membrane protein related to purine degradation [uncultured Ramlibacter sp.]